MESTYLLPGVVEWCVDGVDSRMVWRHRVVVLGHGQEMALKTMVG